MSQPPSGAARPTDDRSAEAQLHVRLLGEFAVSFAGNSVAPAAWTRRGARQLVKLLAVQPRQRLHREEIIDALWPDHDPTVAAGSLRALLHLARRAIATVAPADLAILAREGDEVALQSPGLAWIDARAFEAAAAAGLRDADPAVLQQALDLYTGDPLPEDRYEDWTAVWRESLRERFLAVHVGLADALSGRAEHARAAEVLERALQLDPVDEDVAARLMRQYVATSQRQRALRVYRRLREALASELDAPPDPATERLYAEILAGHADAMPRDATVNAMAAHNLPEPLTRFIGREATVTRVRAAVAANPIVTLAGVGGVGKTRLAIEAARGMVANFADGIWFVDLSAARSDDAVHSAILLVLSSSPLAAADWPALVEERRDRSALLVLDNCEHLIDSVAEAAQALLGPGRGVRILATSREPLRIGGEVVVRVPALTVGSDDGTAEHGSSEAASLFVDRARQHNPDFAPTPGDLASIDAICERLDGLPLAIELAAARVTALSVEQLGGRMEDPFHVLGAGSRTDSPRHRTLWDTIDWSYGLLDPSERLLFDRLSVFDGGFSLDAAEAVASGDGIDRRDVLSLVAQLVDKSLIQVEAGVDEVRYRLLETVRRFAVERLLERGEQETIARCHADWFLALAEAADIQLRGREQGRWLRQLDVDIDNIRAALRTFVRQGDVDGELRLSTILLRLWWVRGYVSEGRRWLEDAIERARATPGANRRLIADAMMNAGALALSQGEAAYSEALFEESLALNRQLGDPIGIADVLHQLATALRLRGDALRAMPLAEESLALRREHGNAREIALSLGLIGELSIVANELDAAETYLRESLEMYRASGDRHSVAITLNNLGEVYRGLGALDQAAACCQESLEIFRALDAAHGVAYLLASLGDIATLQGRVADAQRDYREALTTFRRLAYTAAALGVVRGIAQLDAAWGQPARASTLFAAADALLVDTGASWTPLERAERDRGIDRARALLGEEAFDAAVRAGACLTLDEAVALALSVDLAVPAAERPSALSPREREVAELVARGLTNRQIAAAIGVSQRTAETHVLNALRKLGVDSRQDIGGALTDRV